jgi:hypothetical protein
MAALGHLAFDIADVLLGVEDGREPPDSTAVRDADGDGR